MPSAVYMEFRAANEDDTKQRRCKGQKEKALESANQSDRKNKVKLKVIPRLLASNIPEPELHSVCELHSLQNACCTVRGNVFAYPLECENNHFQHSYF